MSVAKAEALAEWAETLITTDHDPTAGRWPQAAAILTRRSLEVGLDAVWVSRGVVMEEVSWRAQFLSLPRYVDASVARTAHHTYDALSQACHHHAYNLPPTAGELLRWIGNVRELLREVKG